MTGRPPCHPDKRHSGPIQRALAYSFCAAHIHPILELVKLSLFACIWITSQKIGSDRCQNMFFVFFVFIVFTLELVNAAIIAQSAGLSATSTISGNSECTTQNLKVSVTTNNFVLRLGEPPNQTVVTETLVELLQNGSDLFSTVNGGQHEIKDTYNINGKLCVPSSPSAVASIKTIQFLNHGDTLDSTYWISRRVIATSTPQPPRALLPSPMTGLALGNQTTLIHCKWSKHLSRSKSRTDLSHLYAMPK